MTDYLQPLVDLQEQLWTEENTAKFNRADGNRRLARNSLRSLPAELQVAFVVTYLDTQVINGGFDQWITNPTGVYVEESARVAREIGAVGVASLIESIVDRLPKQALADSQAARIGALSSLSDDDVAFLDQCDETYFDLRIEFLKLACCAAGIEVDGSP